MKVFRETCLLTFLAISSSAFSEGIRYRGIFVNDEDWGLRPCKTTSYALRCQFRLG